MVVVSTIIVVILVFVVTIAIVVIAILVRRHKRKFIHRHLPIITVNMFITDCRAVNKVVSWK